MDEESAQAMYDELLEQDVQREQRGEPRRWERLTMGEWCESQGQTLYAVVGTLRREG